MSILDSIIQPLQQALQPDPGTTYGSVLPVKRDSQGNLGYALPSVERNALLGLLQAPGDLAAAFKAPGDVLAGTTSPSQGAGDMTKGLLWAAGGDLAVGKDAAAGAIAHSIPAYHGTPYTFEPVEDNPFGAFQEQKIGTGEGAQAYGYGHYVAGSPKVASSYKQTDSSAIPIPEVDSIPVTDFYAEHPHGVDSLLPDRMGIPPGGLQGQPAKDLLLTSLNHDITNLTNTLTDKNQIWRNIDSPQDYLNHLQNKLADTTAIKQHFENVHPDLVNIPEPPSGNLYQVAIKPDEHELLDWDGTRSEQSPQVQQALAKIRPSLVPGDPTSAFPPHFTGNDVYQWLQDNHQRVRDQFGLPGRFEMSSPEAASKALDRVGVPGIKYLDQGSRAAGEGTRNYVIFHPSNLTITHRNGVGLEPIEGNPFGAGQ